MPRVRTARCVPLRLCGWIISPGAQRDRPRYSDLESGRATRQSHPGPTSGARLRLAIFSAPAEPLLNNRLEHAPQRRMILEQGMESLLIHTEQVHFGDSSCRRHTWIVVHQSHLAEAFARSDAA